MMSDGLLQEWLKGLDVGVRETINLTDVFSMKTVAKPDKKSVFVLIVPHRRFNHSLAPYPDGEFYISSDGQARLAICTVGHDVNNMMQPIVNVILSNPTVFGEEDVANALPLITPILKRMASSEWESYQLISQPRYEKEKLVSLIPKSEVPAKGEFTLGVHAPFVTEVLAKHFCDANMEKSEVLKRLAVLERAAMGGRREYIAKLDLVRQLIAYGLVFRVREGKVEFMVYKRNKLNGEKQMVSVFSIGIGGHAEVVDDFADYMAFEEKDGVLDARPDNLSSTNVMDLYGTTDKSYHRESPEEVTIYQGDVDVTAGVFMTGTPIGFVCDSSDVQGFVGNSHFGIIYAAEAPSNATFEMNEPNLDEVAWLDHDTLVDLLFARAYVKGQQVLNFPCGDVMLEAGVSVRDRSMLDKPEYKQFLEGDFEPWSQYIIHNLHNLVDRILSRDAA